MLPAKIEGAQLPAPILEWEDGSRLEEQVEQVAATRRMLDDLAFFRSRALLWFTLAPAGVCLSLLASGAEEIDYWIVAPLALGVVALLSGLIRSAFQIELDTHRRRLAGQLALLDRQLASTDWLLEP